MASKIRKTDNATVYTCKRGWLITMDDEGGYLPFFVKVRHEDIIWDNQQEYSVFENLINRLNRFGYNYQSAYLDPKLQLEIKADGWIYHINSDSTFRATYVGIADTSSMRINRNADNYIVSADFYIPIPIKVLSAETLILGNLEPIGTSILQFTGGRRNSDTTSAEYDSVDIKIFASYDANVYAQFNSNLITQFYNNQLDRHISLYMEGKISN